MFVIQMWTMIDEKEHKLPTMLQHMGMTDTAYLLSWIFSHLITNTAMTILLTGMGAIFGFQQFLITDYGLMLLCFWLGTLGFTGMALFMQADFELRGTRERQNPVMRLKPPTAWMHISPGTIGTVMPYARHASTKVTKTAGSKNI